MRVTLITAKQVLKMTASLELEKMKAQVEEEAVLQKVSQAMYKCTARIQ